MMSSRIHSHLCYKVHHLTMSKIILMPPRGNFLAKRIWAFRKSFHLVLAAVLMLQSMRTPQRSRKRRDEFRWNPVEIVGTYFRPASVLGGWFRYKCHAIGVCLKMSGCSIQKPLLIVTWWWKWWFPSGFRSTTCSDKPMWAVGPWNQNPLPFYHTLSTGWLTGSPPYWMMMIPYIPGSMIPYVLWTNHGLFSCKRGWYPPSTGLIYPW